MNSNPKEERIIYQGSLAYEDITEHLSLSQDPWGVITASVSRDLHRSPISTEHAVTTAVFGGIGLILLALAFAPFTAGRVASVALILATAIALGVTISLFRMYILRRRYDGFEISHLPIKSKIVSVLEGLQGDRPDLTRLLLNVAFQRAQAESATEGMSAGSEGHAVKCEDELRQAQALLKVTLAQLDEFTAAEGTV